MRLSIVCIAILLLAMAVAAVSGCSAIKNATAVGMTKTKCLHIPTLALNGKRCCLPKKGTP